MEVGFLSGEITGVRHLVDANPHVHTPWNLPEKNSKIEYNNLENEHNTFQIFVIGYRRIVVYNKHGI